MECQILFSGKNKKIYFSMLSAEFAYRAVKVKSELELFTGMKW